MGLQQCYHDRTGNSDGVVRVCSVVFCTFFAEFTAVTYGQFPFRSSSHGCVVQVENKSNNVFVVEIELTK